MISLADFEPLSVAEINILIEEVPGQTTLRDGESFRRLAQGRSLSAWQGILQLLLQV